MPEATGQKLKLALITNEIDRLTLAKLGLSNDHIDRLYRTLYVVSGGFF